MSSIVVTANETSTMDRAETRRVLLGAGLGMTFEWYDFFLYAILAVTFSSLFFPEGNRSVALLASFATFGAGFVVRPFGAIVFGRLGDTIGRRYTFLITITIMGLGTAAIGVLPTFAQVGWVAPALLVVCRLIQGLALGGEYGGATTYVAEHSSPERRGFLTSCVQATVWIGQIAGVLTVLVCRLSMSPADFAAWGWRLPFLLSVVLLVISVYVRLKLRESPLFVRMKAEGKRSRAPITEALASLANLKLVLLGFMVSAAQGVISYSGQVYVLSYLEAVLRVDGVVVTSIMGGVLVCGIPMVLVIGWASDKIGRKWLLLGGCLLFTLSAMPLFRALTHFANPALEEFQAHTPIVVSANDCSFRLFVTPTTKLSECDRVRGFLSRFGLSYESLPATGEDVVTTIGATEIRNFKPAELTAALKSAGYSDRADTSRINFVGLVAVLLVLALCSSLVYAPLAAFLVEQFPTRIRYTSVSVAYNFGGGWFGGLAPFVISALAVYSGNIYAGFYYPIALTALVFVIGVIAIREKKDVRLSEGR
jgi:MFS family permease